MSRTSIRFGGYQPGMSVHTRAAGILGAALEHRLGPGVDFTMIENVTEAGRKAADLLPMVEQGELDLCYFSSSYLVGRVPDLAIFDLPFQTSDRDHAYARLDGPLGRRLAESVAAATGFRVLGFWDNGFRHISNRLRPIRRPEDCRGMRIRTLDNALHQDVFRALGFEPVVIDVRELPGAVASHAVDAQENPLTNLVNFDLHKTHRFVSLTSHFFGVALVLCNRERFDGWPAPVREAVTEATREATLSQRRFAAEEDKRCLALLTAEGVTVTHPEEIDLPAFVAAVRGLVERAGLPSADSAL